MEKDGTTAEETAEGGADLTENVLGLSDQV